MGTILKSLKKIKPKYIGVWLKDQLGKPDWFRSLVVERREWGAFSIYSHARRSDEKPKIAYTTKVNAEKGALEMSKKYGVQFVAYKCLFCDGWHVSKTTARKWTNVEKDPTEKYTATAMNSQGDVDT